MKDTPKFHPQLATWVDTHNQEHLGRSLKADYGEGTLSLRRNLSRDTLVIEVNGETVEINRKQQPALWRRLLAYSMGGYTDDQFRQIERRGHQMVKDQADDARSKADAQAFQQALDDSGISYENLRKYELSRWHALRMDPRQILKFLQLTDKMSYRRQANLAEWLYRRGSITLSIHSRLQAWAAIRLMAIWDLIRWKDTSNEAMFEGEKCDD